MKIKSYLGKHKKIFITVSISLIAISLLGGTYAMFQRLDKAEYANNYKTGLLQIVFDDTSEGLGGVISVEGAVPMSDSDGVNSTPYKFKIINQGNLDYKFDLKLVIDADYTSTHGCSDNQLNADYIMIKFNDEEPVTLSSLSDNVIKSDIELKVGQDVTYELRAWLKEGTPNTEIGKHYHGKLTTNGNAIYTVGPNAPVLAEGMIPIAYDGTNWVKADTNNTNNNWYNYGNKMWANAVMINNNILYDKSGSGNNSLISGLTYNTDGLLFDGSDDYVQIPTDLGVTLPATYTVRFKTTSTSNQIIFGDYTTKAALGLFNSNSSLIVVLGNEATNIFDTGGLSLNTFYTITLVYNSLTDITAYLNGVELTKSSSTNNWSWDDTNSYIGKRSSGTYFVGTISNFIVHDKAVTASEVANLANNQVPTDNLKLNYDFTTDTRNQFMNSSSGVVVPEDVILAYYVWIPRYKYQLFNATYESGTSSQLIDVVFENGTSTTGTVTCTYDTNGNESCQNKANGNYYTHPAFTFGSTELKGIWVGKFETTGSTTTPTVKPGITSLRNINVASMYTASKLIRSTDYLTTNGVSTADSHMMKNIEWGAVAYLKQSIYGLGTTDIANNNSSSYITGRSTGDPTVTSYTSEGTYKYNEPKIEKELVEGTGTELTIATPASDSTYTWTNIGTSDSPIWKSANQGVASSSTTLTYTFTLTGQGVLSFDYSASSESANYDYLYYEIKQNDTTIDNTGTTTKIGGTSYGTADDSMTYISKTHILSAGSYTLVFTYKKDSSVDKGTDSGYVKNVKVIDGAEARITYLIEQGGGAASTTGNVTGIYDMSGGAYEYVMGNYNKTAGDSYLTVSGVPAEHIDIYSGTSVSASHLGDALGETAGWYDDDAYFVSSSLPWFGRGGYYGKRGNAGVLHFDSFSGVGNFYGFRVVLSTTGA